MFEEYRFLKVHSRDFVHLSLGADFDFELADGSKHVEREPSSGMSTRGTFALVDKAFPALFEARAFRSRAYSDTLLPQNAL